MFTLSSVHGSQTGLLCPDRKTIQKQDSNAVALHATGLLGSFIRRMDYEAFFDHARAQLKLSKYADAEKQSIVRALRKAGATLARGRGMQRARDVYVNALDVTLLRGDNRKLVHGIFKHGYNGSTQYMNDVRGLLKNAGQIAERQGAGVARAARPTQVLKAGGEMNMWTFRTILRVVPFLTWAVALRDGSLAWAAHRDPESTQELQRMSLLAVACSAGAAALTHFPQTRLPLALVASGAALLTGHMRDQERLALVPSPPRKGAPVRPAAQSRAATTTAKAAQRKPVAVAERAEHDSLAAMKATALSMTPERLRRAVTGANGPKPQPGAVHGD